MGLYQHPHQQKDLAQKSFAFVSSFHHHANHTRLFAAADDLSVGDEFSLKKQMRELRDLQAKINTQKTPAEVRAR